MPAAVSGAVGWACAGSIHPPAARGAGAEADAFVPETVLSWDVDWPNFTDEYPNIDGTAEDWRRRLALALERSWRPHHE